MLVVSLVGMPLSTQAALIETDQVLRQAQTQSDRNRVSDLVARADVQQALQSYGVTPQAAQERVAALTDTEIQQITGKLDSLPAGAIGAGETVLIVVLVIVAIYVILQHIYPRR
jgi:hypothetical protein